MEEEEKITEPQWILGNLILLNICVIGMLGREEKEEENRKKYLRS